MSKVPNRESGQIKPYEDVKNEIDFRVFSSEDDFKRIDESFKQEVDINGVPMIDIARRYWDDPDFAEKQRREIAERKKRGR